MRSFLCDKIGELLIEKLESSSLEFTNVITTRYNLKIFLSLFVKSVCFFHRIESNKASRSINRKNIKNLVCCPNIILFNQCTAKKQVFKFFRHILPSTILGKQVTANAAKRESVSFRSLIAQHLTKQKMKLALPIICLCLLFCIESNRKSFKNLIKALPNAIFDPKWHLHFRATNQRLRPKPSRQKFSRRLQ